MSRAPTSGFRVDAVGAIRTISNGAWQPAGRIVIDGVQQTTWLGPFSSSERDLLRVFSAVLDADRLSPRQPSDGGREMRALIWQRQIDIEIAVEDPGRWTAVSAAVATLLKFMTDDSWNLTFVPASKPPEQQLMPAMEVREADEVALFSGGLDSILGLYLRSRETPRRFLAVSACGNDVRGRAQLAAVRRLQEEGVDVQWLKFVHQLRGSHRSRRQIESSQRTRGLLFLSMGAAAACRLEKAHFAVYETGVGCINMSICRAQVGAEGTRALHPRTLTLFNAMLEAVLDRPVRVFAPFFLSTKGELCRAAGDKLSRFASVTNSCDEGDGHKPNPMHHCGVCTSCLFRRIALHTAGRGDPSTYRDRVMRKHGEYEQRAFEYHARDLMDCANFADLLQLDPNVRFSREAPLSDAPTAAEAEKAVLSMYRRYAAEIEGFLANAKPRLTCAHAEARKEERHDLFSAVG